MQAEEVTNKKGRLVGDNVIFFFVHNLLSVLIFFWLALTQGLLTVDLVSMNLFFTFNNFILVAFISFIAGCLGRGMGLVLMILLFEVGEKKVLRRSQDTNTLRAGIIILLGGLGALTILTNSEYGFFIFGTLIIVYIFISKFDSSAIAFIISSFLSSLFWILGAIVIIQSSFFNENTLFTLLLSYLILKIVIFVVTRGLLQSIL